MFDRILGISPHTDDVELGAGGTISRMKNSGKEIFYVALSACETVVPDCYPQDILRKEVQKSTQILGIPAKNLQVLDFEVRRFQKDRQKILDALIEIAKDTNPDTIFIPSLNDLHQDHIVTARECLRAFKSHTLLTYELPWNQLSFSTSCFIKISEDDLDRKIMALQCYETQQERPYFDVEFIRGLAITRGLQIREKFAEAFNVKRWIIK